ncbi:MAG: hypothetical protein EZS26_002175 [Candidatus Ordinivivax streblomastigis]|uniref:Uncharacterized protein n=1 Tax=Candidatus Ordinivivax streblomastigis TaxID=2540710 RepID=A0A5M8P017_9BACT|nr:MAG: hypothetical protein EZS26_002175 [Candidatus Ordinivivax streblomastigis]
MLKNDFEFIYHLNSMLIKEEKTQINTIFAPQIINCKR